MNKSLHVALYHPEIPQNTGNIGRLCLGIGARLHLIHPLGFDIGEKAVRRAGLDYWKYVDLMEHQSYSKFLEWANGRRIVGLSTKAKHSLRALSFKPDNVLLFGPETKGLPEEVRTRIECARIPMTGSVRSLNLSNAVAVSAYRAMADIDPAHF
jgi:tRNA (cytidine/uridine-2'-O-)-methyltransferase